MKISEIVKTKNGYVWIDTCSLDNPFANMLDIMGLGNDDAIGYGYETMVFPCDEKGNVSSWADLDKANYNTEEEARKGHEKMVKKWRDREW